MSPRYLHSCVGLLLLLALAGCARPQYIRHRQVTGTCEGACNYYLACKQSSDQEAQRACVTECREIFSSAETLKAFERLDCADAIAFVEGTSGRGPGEPAPEP